MIGIIFSIIIGLVGAILTGSIFENLDANELMVIQSPIKGVLTVHTEAGMKWQGFGKVTKYKRRSEYNFCSAEHIKNCTSENPAKKLRFNDGGHGDLSGAVSWQMPLSESDIIKVHREFGSQLGIEQQAVAKMIDSAVYLAGPLMSSTESSGERRAELVQYINDQAENGVYVTKPRTTTIEDPITGEKKSTVITEIEHDKAGNPRRQQGSILKEYNIKLLPMSISGIDYDRVVEEQIKRRQEATTAVQIAIANARKAEQDALTIEKQGQASAAEAKWKQETIKAQMVTEAQQKLEVATLAAEEAEQFKREQILRGEGEAERKRLVMEADGALDPKLQAYISVNEMYANAIANYKGQWVPSVVMGASSSGETSNGAQDLINLLTYKTAKDLSLDLSIKGTTSK